MYHPLRKTLPAFFALMTAVAISTASARAEKVIDTFDQTAQFLDQNVVGDNFDSAMAPEAIGGWRDLQLTVTAINGFGSELGVDQGNNNLLTYSEGNSDGFFIVTWDGDMDAMTLDPTGLGGMDLTEGGMNDRFVMVATDDLGMDVTMTVYSGAGVSSALTVNVPGGPGFNDYVFPFASFVGTADFMNVGAIQLQVAPGIEANDFQIQSLVATPEPAGAVLMLIGMCSLACAARLRRRRR